MEFSFFPLIVTNLIGNARPDEKAANMLALSRQSLLDFVRGKKKEEKKKKKKKKNIFPAKRRWMDDDDSREKSGWFSFSFFDS